MNFYITGYPRSRTSWLANLFTHADSFCFHELSGYGKNYIQLRDILNRRIETYVGTADSALPHYFEEINQGKNQFRLAIIERELSDIRKSFQNTYEENFHEGEFLALMAGLKDKIDYMKIKYNPMVVQYDDLDNEKAIELLWNHLIPGRRFDLDRYRMLKELKIEPIKKAFHDSEKRKNMKSIIGGL